MLKFLWVAIAALFIQGWPTEAAAQNCMIDYYRTKAPGCIDSVLSQFRQAGSSKSDPSTVIGFLAQLFAASPEEKQRLLANEPSDYIKSINLLALHRAGQIDDARTFADQNQLSAAHQKMQESQLKPLAEVRPSSIPADNDLLIGAYMASGDTTFIERILENYSSADDGMVSDGFRIGLMKGKFGNKLVSRERENVTIGATCAKYQCKTDSTKLRRVLTLSTAFWALQSLAQQDDGIKKTYDGFLARDTRLENLLAAEQAGFGNYLTALALVAAFKPDQGSADADPTYAAMNKAALAYENLEPAGNVFSHIEAFTKSGQKSK